MVVVRTRHIGLWATVSDAAVEQHERVAGASQFLRHRASVLSSEVPMLLRLSHCTDLANVEPDGADMRSSLILCKITVQRYL